MKLEVEVELERDAVLEDGDEQHDGEAGEHACVLQGEVSQLAGFVFLAVAVQHLGQLFDKKEYISQSQSFKGFLMYFGDHQAHFCFENTSQKA